MARLIAGLIRHGDYRQQAGVPSAHQPYPLTEKGCAQALAAGRELAQILQQQSWQLVDEIDCSLQLRAWQTATLIAESLDFPCRVHSHPDLAERSLGSAANLNLAEIQQIVEDDPRFPSLPADWKSNSDFQLPLPGAESLMQAGRRVAAYLNQRMAELKPTGDSLKLFVGHGASFRHAAHCLGVLERDDIAALSMYHARPVLLEYTANGRWQHIGGDWKVRGAEDSFRD